MHPDTEHLRVSDWKRLLGVLLGRGRYQDSKFLLGWRTWKICQLYSGDPEAMSCQVTSGRIPPCKSDPSACAGTLLRGQMVGWGGA